MRKKNVTFDWPGFLQRQMEKASSPTLKRFYESQNYDASLSVERASYVSVDFETTGLNADKDDIVSIGVVPFGYNRIRVGEAKQWLVRPDKPMTADSIVIHGITHSQLDDAPDILEVLDQVLAAIEGRIVVVHCKYIERQFLYNAIKERINESLLFPVIDTMSQEARIHRQGFKSVLKNLFGRGRESIRLTNSRARYGLPRYHVHSAIMDALATAELLQAQLQHHYDPDTLVSELWE